MMNYHSSTWKVHFHQYFKITSTSHAQLYRDTEFSIQLLSELEDIKLRGEGLLPQVIGWWEIIQNARLPPAGQVLHYSNVFVERMRLALGGSLSLLHAVHKLAQLCKP